MEKITHVGEKKTLLSNNTMKIFCQHLICIFCFYYVVYSVIHMNVFIYYSKGLLYDSSPLIKLRKNALF